MLFPKHWIDIYLPNFVLPTQTQQELFCFSHFSGFSGFLLHLSEWPLLCCNCWLSLVMRLFHCGGIFGILGAQYSA